LKISMFTSGFMRYPLERAFKEAHNCGYDGIEIWGGRPHAYAPDLRDGDLEKIIKFSRDYNLPIVGYTPETNAYPFNLMAPEAKMRREAVKYVKLCLEMAKEMGAGFTLISSGHAGNCTDIEENWRVFLEIIHELAEHAEKVGQDLILEALTPYESNLITRADDLVKVLREVKSPRLKTMVDVVPPFVLNEPVMDYFYKLGDKLAHIHLIDSDGKSDTHILPGDGVMPLRQLLATIREYGYDKYYTIELVTAYINEPALFARLAIDRVRELSA
jgi:fructoselysine 3-epimerase